MFKLRNTRPGPAHFVEHTYGEAISVDDGMCTVTRIESRDFLLKIGYELVVDELKSPEDPSPPILPSKKKNAKKTRKLDADDRTEYGDNSNRNLSRFERDKS